MTGRAAAAVLLLLAPAVGAAAQGLTAQEVAPSPTGAASPPPGTGPPADALVLRARERLDWGDWSGALALLRPAMEERREDPAFQSALARAYSELGEDAAAGDDEQDGYVERAVVAARRAVQLAPEWGWPHLDLAAALGKLANAAGPRTRVRLAPEVAREARRALELDPDLWQAHHVLGVWHREIATLGLFEELGAALLGGVPDATLEESIAHLGNQPGAADRAEPPRCSARRAGASRSSRADGPVGGRPAAAGSSTSSHRSCCVGTALQARPCAAHRSAGAKILPVRSALLPSGLALQLAWRRSG